MKGEQIYITHSEYEAIQHALCEIETNCEGSDEEYIEGTRYIRQNLISLIDKFNKQTNTRNENYRNNSKI